VFICVYPWLKWDFRDSFFHMSRSNQQQDAIAPYSVRTHNPSSASENRMHSDEVARRYGFRGGLVPGVTVFGHMTRPVVAHFGAAWLERGWAEVTFSKPAYEGEMLTVRTAVEEGEGGPELASVCSNESGIELARMSSGLPRTAIEPDARALAPPAQRLSERPEVTWELMQVDEPFPAFPWSATARENQDWCDDLGDDLPLYREDPAVLHPGLVLRQANNVLKHRFVLPAWIHTGSRIVMHAAARPGADYEVRAIPEEKWLRKGHEFVRLYVVVRTGDTVVAEILHTAIFRPRQTDAVAE